MNKPLHMKGLGLLVLGILALAAWGQEIKNTPPPLPQEATAATPAAKKVRMWAKACPLCGTVCVTTIHHWNMTSKIERMGSVQFACTNDECEGLQFWEEIRQPFRYTNAAPMIEITH